MSTPTRYLLLQLPGLGFVALGLAALWYTGTLSGSVALGGGVLWVVKDLLMYPLVRGSYAGSVRTGAERLVGTRAVAREPLDPIGYVIAGGELWRAEVEAGNGPVPAGDAVSVRAVRGLTLIVTPEAKRGQVHFLGI